MRRIISFVKSYPAVAATLVVAAVALPLWLTTGDTTARWIVSIFALGIAAWQGWGMVRDLLHGQAGIDILAVVAIVATVVVGEYWAALVIVLMLSGGEALEDYAQGRANRELTALLDKAPQIAHRLVDGEATEDIAVDEVHVGDRLVVRPGDVVPVDGTVVEGTGSVDESSLTGESLPVEKTAGDQVLSGSLNGDAALVLEATATASDSQYQQLMALVEAAQQSKAPMVRLADRYAVPFTLVAFALAGAAWWISGDPVRFAEVLVVATPCPLLIAAPVAFIAGMSRSAKSGIIVKGGGVLERLARVRTAAFDKTGTLTRGEPWLSQVQVASTPLSSVPDAGALLGMAAAAEQYSGHVLAQAIVGEAAAQGIALPAADNITERSGYGVTASVNGSVLTVGKRAMLTEGGIQVDAPLPGPGEIAVCVAVDGQYAGQLLLADQIRPDAKETLRDLHGLGVAHIMMLTGDSSATALHIAKELDIDQVRANCLPDQKVEAVKTVTERPVMMVGDGVNDAPVLAAADIGVAMGARGSSAASESADAVILLDDIHRVATAVRIGKRTTAIALQAIWAGIGLSTVLMVIATFGLLPAVAGAGLQEIVDLVAILSALRALTPGRGEEIVRGRRQDAAVAAKTRTSPGASAPVAADHVEVSRSHV